MNEHDLLDKAIAALKANSELIITKDGIAYQDLILWLEELKERRKGSYTEYDMELVRKQWEED